MNYLTIDIETSGLDLDKIPDEDKQIYDKLETEDERKKFIDLLPLNPFTSQIACIGIKKTIQNEHDKGYVLINSIDKIESENTDYKFVCFEEQTILQKFQEYLGKQKNEYKFITYNGRDFDFPYLMIRSTYLKINNIVNLMLGSDWTMNKYHIDVMRELSFNKFSGNGPLKRRSLDYMTKRFLGKTSKTEDEQGKFVTELFKKGELSKIANYNIRDLEYTFDLFLELKKFQFI